MWTGIQVGFIPAILLTLMKNNEHSYNLVKVEGELTMFALKDTHMEMFFFSEVLTSLVK